MNFLLGRFGPFRNEEGETDPISAFTAPASCLSVAHPFLPLCRWLSAKVQTPQRTVRGVYLRLFEVSVAVGKGRFGIREGTKEDDREAGRKPGWDLQGWMEHSWLVRSRAP